MSKGFSMIQKKEDPVKPRPIIIDVEASGFGQSGYPIEIGLAWNRTKRYCSLIVPSNDWTHWDESAQAVHHITRDTLIRHGKTIRQVAIELNEKLDGCVVYSDGWVVEKPWINKLFWAAGMAKAFFISPLERVLSEKQMEIWHRTKDRIVKDLNLTRHRASTDAFIVQETYMQTLSKTSDGM